MKRVFCYGIIFVLLSSFTSLSGTVDPRSNVEFILNIGDWIINPVEYTGKVEVIYTGDENTSISINKLEIFLSENILWETNISKELRGTGDDYYVYKNALESYAFGVKSGAAQAFTQENYKTIERLALKISESTYRIKVPIDPNKIFPESEFRPGNKKEIIFKLAFNYQNETYEITKSMSLEIREPLPIPPPLKSPNNENFAAASSGVWSYGDLHVHSTYTDCDDIYGIGPNGDQTIAQRKARAQSVGMKWLSITDHSYCFDSSSEWNSMYWESINNSDSSFIIFPSEELSVSEDCSTSSPDEEWWCWDNCSSGDAGHMGAHSLSSFISNTPNWCNSKRCPDYPSSQQGISLANSQGFSIINHPIADKWDWESMNCTSGETGVEIWNGYWAVEDRNAIDTVWVPELLAGKKIYAYAGGDIEDVGALYCPFPIGPCPDLGVVYNGVWSDSFTRTGLVNALKRGSLFMTNYPALTIQISYPSYIMMGSEWNISSSQQIEGLVYADAGSYSGTISVYKGVIGQSNEDYPIATFSYNGPNYYPFYDTPTSNTYYRAEFYVWNYNYYAFTNPVWVNVVAQTLYVPYVIDTADFRSNLGLSNLNPTTANVTISFYTNTGSLNASRSTTVPQNSYTGLNNVIRWARNLGETSATNLQGYLKIESDQTIYAIGGPIDNVVNDPSILVGVTTTVNNGFTPIAQKSGPWSDQIVITNMGSETANVTLMAYPSAGGTTPVKTKNIVIAKKTQWRNDDVVTYMGITPPYVGMLSWTSNQPLLVFFRIYSTSRGGGIYPIHDMGNPGYTTLYIPYVVDTTDFRSNLGLSNINATTANATIYFYKNDGTFIASRSTTVPRNSYTGLNNVIRWVRNLGETSPTNLEGYLIIVSDVPIYAIGGPIDNVVNDPSILVGVTTTVNNGFTPIAQKSGPWSDQVVITNMDWRGTYVTLYAYPMEGGTMPVASTTIWIAPNSQWRTDDLITYMGIAPPFVGMLSWTTDQPLLFFFKICSTSRMGGIYPVYGIV